MRQPLPRKKESGVALLLAILIVAILAAAITDFLYRSRVDLDAVSNYEDMQQARYAARGGIETGIFFMTALKPNEWADALITLGVPDFGDGGFIFGAEEAKKTKAKEELEGQVFNDSSNLTGISFASDYYDLYRNDPDGFNNGYILFIPGMSGFSLFDASDNLDIARTDDVGDEEAQSDLGDVDVKLRFIDESSRLNLNALYYCPAGSGCGASNEYDRVLYFQIRQLFINEVIRKKEEAKGLFGAKESERKSREEGMSDRELEEKPIEVSEIDDIMCAILDWLDPDDQQSSNDGCDNGAERDYYTGLDEPYEPRDGPMESVGELRLVKGMTAEIYRAVAPYLTVYPQKSGSDCTSRLQTLRSTAPPGLNLVCFDDRVNLMAASDAVIAAWAIGGFNPAETSQPDSRGRDSKEFREELLTLLNCARLPTGKQEENGCPVPAAGVQPAPNCWAKSADIKAVLEQSGLYSIKEVGDIPNVGTAGSRGIKCSSQGTGGQNQNQGVLGQPQQDFRLLVGDYVTVEAIGQVGLASEDVSLTGEDESLDEEDEDADPPPLPIEKRITATYFIDSSKSPTEPKLLRWVEN